MPVSWQSRDTFAPVHPQIADWLLNTASLTERLQALCKTFEVEVIGQQIAPMDKSESEFINDDTFDKYQVREVILKGDGQDWVYARSLIPQALCEAELANLGNNPLGKRIFNDPEFERSDFEVGRLLTDPLSGEVPKHHALYARRSLFSNGLYQVLVAEAFLPASPCYASLVI